MAGDTFDNAVDQAVSTLSGVPASNPATPSESTSSAPSSSPLSASAAPPDASAAGSGSEPAPSENIEAASTAPASGEDDGEILQSQAWLDLEKRRSILNNARAKERQRVIESEFGLPRGANLEQWRPHIHALSTDVVGYWRQLGETLLQAGILPNAPQGQYDAGSAPSAPQARPDPRQQLQRPEPALIFADGRRAFDEAGAEQLVSWAITSAREDMRREFEQRFGPLEQTDTRLRAEEVRMTAHRVAADAIGEAKTWAHFEELRPQIAELMEGDRRVTLFSAYNRLLQPLLRGKSERIKEETRLATLKEVQSRPGGRTSIVPGASNVAVASNRGRSMEDVFDRAVSAAIAKHAG